MEKSYISQIEIKFRSQSKRVLFEDREQLEKDSVSQKRFGQFTKDNGSEVFSSLVGTSDLSREIQREYKRSLQIPSKRRMESF